MNTKHQKQISSQNGRHIFTHLTPLREHIRPYCELARLEKPVGTWLIFFPALMGLTFAEIEFQNQINIPEMNLPFLTLGNIVLFLAGSFLMRGAGCTVNDILDRHFDKNVARTKGRPLPSNRLTVKQAVIFLCIQLVLALGLVPFVNPQAWIIVPFALALAMTYPLFKRFTFFPQIFLGFCMNASFIFAYVHASGHISLKSLVLYCALIFWTIAYDTVYGHMDKQDDVQVGIKSTALHPFTKSKTFLYISYSLCGVLFGCTLFWLLNDLDLYAKCALAIIAGTFFWQLTGLYRLDLNNVPACLKFFKNNVYVGYLLWITLLLIM